eukprot:m.935477 g.935477  ORF g.935477 m.935477 type:complete len:157 (-) comp23804_c0_seq9:2450-2920(-)
MSTPLRRSGRSTAGKSPSRLGQFDGWATSPAGEWNSRQRKGTAAAAESSGKDSVDSNPDTDTIQKGSSNLSKDVPKLDQLEEKKSDLPPHVLGPVGIAVLCLIFAVNVTVIGYVGVVVAGKGDAFVEGATGMWAAVAFALAGVALIFASSITPNTS